MKKSICIGVIVLLFVATAVTAQQNTGSSISVSPAFELPVAKYGAVCGPGGAAVARVGVPV